MANFKLVGPREKARQFWVLGQFKALGTEWWISFSFFVLVIVLDPKERE
jgi:hypothetical protein